MAVAMAVAMAVVAVVAVVVANPAVVVVNLAVITGFLGAMMEVLLLLLLPMPSARLRCRKPVAGSPASSSACNAARHTTTVLSNPVQGVPPIWEQRVKVPLKLWLPMACAYATSENDI